MPRSHPSSAPVSLNGPQHNTTHTLEPLSVLRTQWKWAAFSQFFYTFSQLFAMDDVTLIMIESDLVQSTALVLPRIMLRLLHTLTQDRKITMTNWQAALRRQYLRRDPDANPIGAEFTATPASKSATPVADANEQDDFTNPSKGKERDASETPSDQPPSEPATEHLPSAAPAKDWQELTMLEKLDSMHTLVEWQFQNPLRLRTTMKSHDEQAQWRIEPIGYDAKSNAYWLIGEDRLWIQRIKPRPIRKPPLKRKRPGSQLVEKSSKQQPSRKPVKRSRTSTADESPSRPGRGAKLRAKEKLGEQARELAEFNRQAALLKGGGGRESPRKGTPNLPPTRGTRTSARLRGSVEEWQRVPDEWLKHEGKVPAIKTESMEDNQSDSNSSLSELTEFSDSEEDTFNAVDEISGSKRKSPSPPQIKVEEAEENSSPVHYFVEWETIAATLYEWEHVAERFEKATHYRERALYKLLTNNIIPTIVADLKEVERQRRLEEAVTQRKRSSRIALKESEREEAALAKKREAEEAEKMARTRRAEARQKKELEERMKREAAREQRRREREEREAKRKYTRVDSDSEDIETENPPPRHEPEPARISLSRSSSRASGSGLRTPSSEEWELDCEICGRHGRNLDDGVPLLCCGRCGRWQHIPCHDRINRDTGRPRRNWDLEEFVCRSCQNLRTPSSTSYQYPSPPIRDTYVNKWRSSSNQSHAPIASRNYDYTQTTHANGSARPSEPHCSFPGAPRGDMYDGVVRSQSVMHGPSQQRLNYPPSPWTTDDPNARYRHSLYARSPLMQGHSPTQHLNGVYLSPSAQFNHHQQSPYPSSAIVQNGAVPSMSYSTSPQLVQSGQYPSTLLYGNVVPNAVRYPHPPYGAKQPEPGSNIPTYATSGDGVQSMNGRWAGG